MIGLHCCKRVRSTCVCSTYNIYLNTNISSHFLKCFILPFWGFMFTFSDSFFETPSALISSFPIYHIECAFGCLWIFDDSNLWRVGYIRKIKWTPNAQFSILNVVASAWAFRSTPWTEPKLWENRQFSNWTIELFSRHFLFIFRLFRATSLAIKWSDDNNSLEMNHVTCTWRRESCGSVGVWVSCEYIHQNLMHFNRTKRIVNYLFLLKRPWCTEISNQNEWMRLRYTRTYTCIIFPFATSIWIRKSPPPVVSFIYHW